ncbi:hypothetical protein VHEMI05060 [[Torrubiella] hemipterigena]|uniref:DUF7907 domain-containing protein n=1 Tax=[Torrubiella] hemipterigena TaxID=1531966 RepID=A0A0A1TG60_9HYPO|nr:hypothetical protein VHEMI05060 [[Torrubiella] hemipterigena]
MYAKTALIAALAGAATAAPALSQATQVHLKIQTLNGKDFASGPVNGHYLTAFHTGAGLNVVGTTDDKSRAPTFYNHGKDGHASISADLGTPPTPFGLDVPAYTVDGTAATLNAGAGKDGLATSDGKLEGALWAICDKQVAPIGQQKALYLFNVRGGQTKPLPADCIAVDIVAECAGNAAGVAPDSKATACF